MGFTMPDNITRLYAAVENNDVHELERLLSSGANPNEIYFGMTPLLLAVTRGHLEAVKVLFKYNANPNDGIITPLFIATDLGFLEIVKVLLEYNADPNRASTDRVTILCNMVYKNNLEMINILLAHPKINTAIAFIIAPTPNELMRYAGEFASAENQVDKKMLAYLKKYRERHPDHRQIAITPKDIAAIMGHDAIVAAFNNHSLYKAAKRGDLPVIQDLLTTGIYLDHNAPIQAALAYAAKYGHCHVVQALINAPAIERGVYGMTALFNAVQHNRLDVVKVVLHNKDINSHLVKDNTNKLLFMAIKNDNLEIVQTLLEHHANPNLPNIYHETALVYAAERGNLAIVNALIHAGASPNLASNGGATAIHYAAKNGHTLIAQALIQAGANINKSADNDVTPLYLAAKHKHLNTVLALLSVSCIAFDLKKSAQSIAQQRGHMEIVKVLESHIDREKRVRPLGP